MWVRGGWLGGLFGVLLAGGCDSGNGSSGPVAASDFPARFAQGTCDAMANCCRTNGFAYEASTCKASVEGQFRALFLKNQSSGVTYDAAAGGRCLDAYVALYEGCGSGDENSVKDPCRHVFVGTLAPGEACTASAQCKDPEGGNAYCDGVCKLDLVLASRHGTSGEPCTAECWNINGRENCQSVGDSSATQTAACYASDGLQCDHSALKCTPVPKLGERCSSRCVEGAYCNSGTCAPQVDTGPCGFDACSSKSYCDYDTNTCQPRKADGESCSSDDDCLIGSCSNNRCGRVPVGPSICAGLIGD
jgi:hypothetical protein